MLTDRQIEFAHPEAFDFVFGNLTTPNGVQFFRHLTGCQHCRVVVDEYMEVGQVIKNLPPPVEPPASLEDRTVAAMVAAQAEAAASAGKFAAPPLRPDTEDSDVTRVYPRAASTPAAEHETRVLPRPEADPASEPGRPSAMTSLPVWRRRRGRLAAGVAAAAAIVAGAIVIPLSLTGSPTTVVIPLHATTAAKIFGAGAATATATARQADESWTFDLTVHGLKPLPDDQVYQCWWAGPGSTPDRPVVVTGGSFVVGSSGSATVTMTTGVDPRQFRTMEITVGSPSSGAWHGPVLLTGS